MKSSEILLKALNYILKTICDLKLRMLSITQLVIYKEREQPQAELSNG